MSEASKDLTAASGKDKVGPDFFAYYAREAVELLSEDEDFLPFSSQSGKQHEAVEEKDITRNNNRKQSALLDSLFSNGVGARLSDFKKERMKALLQKSVITLSKEVDEMLDPVFTVRRIQSHLRFKQRVTNYSPTASKDDAEQHPQKKIKLSSSSPSFSVLEPAGLISGGVCGELSGKEINNANLSEKGLSNGLEQICAYCRTTEISKWRSGPVVTESSCHACVKFGKGKEPSSIKDKKKESSLDSDIRDDDRAVNDDLQFLLENDAAKVEESMKKHSDELSTTLGLMEQQLEVLLDAVMSSCRLMTLSEKQRLRKLIQKLPPRNLDRIVEIIQRNTPSGKYSSDEIHVDLEEQDNVTLWRLYYYVEAVEKARKLIGNGTLEA